jgi:N-acetyl sugar amidotransferase
MDTSDPDIVFDDEGICNHCKNYDVRAKKELHHDDEGKKILSDLVEKMKQEGRNGEYDCIAGVSGGVDSTTIVMRAKKLGLRILAVHVDNGWDSELAVSNIEKTLKKLDIDFYTEVIDWEEFKDLQLAFLKASVANIEIPTDHVISSVLFRLASQKGIRYILGGGNIETESIMPKAWGYDWRDWKHIKGIHDKFGKLKLNNYPHAGLWDFFNYVFIKKIKVVRILNLAPYNKKDAIEILKRELGWVSYDAKHYESIFTRFFQGYILPIKFGFDKRRAHLSNLICANQMSRKEALEEMKRSPYSEDLIREDREFVQKKLDLSDKEYDEIMNATIKSHTSYPSNDFIYSDTFGISGLIKKIVAR